MQNRTDAGMMLRRRTGERAVWWPPAASAGKRAEADQRQRRQGLDVARPAGTATPEQASHISRARYPRLHRDSESPLGVVILNNGHCRGVWRWQDGGYAFTPGGYGGPTHAAATPQDALRFTLDHCWQRRFPLHLRSRKSSPGSGARLSGTFTPKITRKVPDILDCVSDSGNEGRTWVEFRLRTGLRSALSLRRMCRRPAPSAGPAWS